MSESFLSTAGSLFFALWTLIVGAFSAAVFGRDLIPAKERVARVNEPKRADLLPPAGSRSR